MSEFAPIFLSFVISSLVSWILFSLPFIYLVLFPEINMRKSFPFLLLGSIVLLFYLLCLKVGLLNMFWELLSRTGSFLVGRALCIKLGCTGGLAFAIGFAMKTLLTSGVAPLMMNPSEGTPGASSSESPATPSDSLIAHASYETDSDKADFFSPPQSFASASSSSTSTPGSGDNSSSQRESLLFDIEHPFWQNEGIRAFNEGLVLFDPKGEIAKIPNGEILEAIGLDSPLISRGEAERCIASLRNPWPSYEEADRTSVHGRILKLVDKYRRPSGL